MVQKRGIGFVFLIVGVIVFPSVAALGWFQLSKNPSLRPLAITEQALAAYNGVAEGPEIVALVDWVPPRTGNYTRKRLVQSLTQAFAAKGVDVRIKFRPGHDATRVTYKIGKTILGPYPTTRASEGIRAAVEAYKMW